MQLRQVSTFLVIFVSLFTSSYSLSLGLGEITLQSYYNEPLSAEFKILQANNLSQNEISVSLASREYFVQAGIDRDFFLTSLQFDIIFDDPSHAYVKVTTREPVKEPYLNFLVEIQWTSGRLLREYTLLLDVPLYDDRNTDDTVVVPNSPFSGASSVSTDIGVQPSSQLTVVDSESVAVVPVSVQSNVSTTETKVMPGDTLWDLARKMRPNQSLNVLQTMVAIQNANPDAFINGNINLLRTGAILRAPTLSEIEGTNHQESAVAVTQQTDRWQQKEAVASVVSPSLNPTTGLVSQEERVTLESGSSESLESLVQSGAGEVLQDELGITQKELDESSQEKSVTPDASLSLNAASELAPQVGRLTLGRPGFSGSQEKPGQGGSSEILQAKLAITQKKLDQYSQENIDLKDRLLELQSLAMLTTAQLTVLEDKISVLQGQFSSGSPLITGSGDTVNNETPLAQSKVNKGVVSENASVVSQDTTTVANNTLYVIIIILLLIVIVFLLIFRSREAAKNYDEHSIDFVPLAPDLESDGVVAVEPSLESDGDVAVEPSLEPDGGVAVEPPSLESDGVVAVELSLELDGVVTTVEPGLEFDDVVAVESSLEPDGGVLDSSESLELSFKDGSLGLDDVETGAVSVVEEAGVYIGLGDLGKGVDLLKREIQKNPDNVEARRALFTLYVKSQHTDALDDEYAQFLHLGDAAEELFTDNIAPQDIDEPLNEKLTLRFLSEDLENIYAGMIGEGFKNEADTDDDLSLSNEQDNLKAATGLEPPSETYDSAQVHSTGSTKKLGLENELDETPEGNDFASIKPKNVDLGDSKISVFDFKLPPTGVDMVSLDLELDEMLAMLDDESVYTTVPEITPTVRTKAEKSLDEMLELIARDSSQIDNININHSEVITSIDDLDSVISGDEVATKLDLVQAYIDMGDLDNAEDILQEVIEEGDEEQKISAERLFKYL
jgi:pilus assembly protein FimV